MLAALTLPYPLDTRGRRLVLRRAAPDDIRLLLALLSDDEVTAQRDEAPDESAAAAALREIGADPGNDLVVAAKDDGTVVGMRQLTRIPGLSRGGATRLLVEGVRVASAHRSEGIGGAMMRWVVDVAAPTAGCTLVQLTSDRARADAHRFYERLGFTASHLGFKLRLARSDG